MCINLIIITSYFKINPRLYYFVLFVLLLNHRKYGFKIALDKNLSKRLQGKSDLSLMNYDFIYKVRNYFLNFQRCVLHYVLVVQLKLFVIQSLLLTFTYFQDEKTRKKEGNDYLVSANFMNLTTLSSMEHLILDHPLFGQYYWICGVLYLNKIL